MISLPRLYAILDISCFSGAEGLLLTAEELVAAGVSLIQYRNKSGEAQIILAQARELRACLRARPPAPHMPRPHLPRLIMNDRSDLCLAVEFDGVHLGQEDAGVRQARSLTRQPLVAIGGITRDNCRSVIEAGADSVAVISDLIRDPRKSAEEFLHILG